MKKELLYLIFFTCSISIPAIAQLSTSHYNFMYNVIKDTLQLDKTTKQVYLKGNKSKAWVNTGEFL